MGPCNQCKRRVCAKEGKSISVVERRKRRSERVHPGTAKERVYPAIKVTSNGAGILCVIRQECGQTLVGLGLGQR